MRRFLLVVTVFLIAGPLRAQNIVSGEPGQDQVVRVRTALNHLTVIELREPVESVAAGSQAFKVEWRENKVFIQPTEENVATNLFVWTASARFNYELDPPGPIPQMDFAIDQPPPDPPAVKPLANTADPPLVLSPVDVLVGSRPVRQYGSTSKKQRVAVNLRDSFEHDGQLFIRYSIENDTKKSYIARAPQVVVLSAPHYSESLYTLSNFQLSPREAARVKNNGASVLETTSEARTSRLEPGQDISSVVVVKLPQNLSRPVVLRLIFPAGPTGPVTATLVQ